MSSKQFSKASVTIRFLSLLLERSFVQLLETEGANKMLWMKLFAHGGDASPGDGLLAARA